MGVVGSIVAFGITGGLGGAMPWPTRARLLAICFIYGCSMALIGPFVIPTWIRKIVRRNGYGWWLGRALALPFIILVGGAIASVLLVLLGLMRPSDTVMLMFPYLRGGPTIAVVAAIFLAVTFYDYLRERIETTALALRTKERDEADARRIAAEAQLASLESRVQPHFLFNTLNSIAALIPTDPAGAEKMTGQLASLLRSSLDSAAESLVPLEQELKVVRDYLDIENVRFGDRLKYRFEIDPRLTGCLVPKLSLQTLVENSVKYAVATRREGGSIVVSATPAAGGVRLEVSDDGPGFDGDNESPAGHGLALLRDRLQMTLGDRGRLSVQSRPGHTTVTMDIRDARLHR